MTDRKNQEKIEADSRETAIHFLDITQEVCPITFVRTRLLLDRMQSGEVAEIRLRGREPLENVPKAATELGHRVDDPVPEPDATADGPHRLRIHKR